MNNNMPILIKKDLKLILLKLLSKSEQGETLPKIFYEASIILIPKTKVLQEKKITNQYPSLTKVPNVWNEILASRKYTNQTSGYQRDTGRRQGKFGKW